MKILLVEDDERIVTSLAEALHDQHYAVDVATDGLQAWELIQIYPYDLIILDWMLPGIDGLTLCQRIRQKDANLPVLMLTARDTSHDKVQGLDVGADDYVVKPFDLAEFLARIRALLRRGNQALPPLLEWGDLQLNPATCIVSYRQQTIALTPKEYELLELFLRQRGKTLRWEEILNHIWPSETTPGRETIKVHIRGLRQKLLAAGTPHEVIETVYGIGYRLSQVPV